MTKGNGNPNWRKGGPSPNPSGKRKDSGGNAVVGGAEVLALLQGMRKDGWENLVTGLGQSGYDKTIGTTFALDSMDDGTAFALWQGDDIGKKIVEVWPAEMLRKPFEIRVGNEKAGEDPEEGEEEDLEPDYSVRADLQRTRRDAAERRNKDVQEQVKKDQKRLRLIPALKQALEYREAFGGSGILMGVEDEVGDISKPLGKVLRGIKFLTVFEPRELQPLWYYNDPAAERYREVSHYQLNAVTAGPSEGNAATNSVGQIIHESRLMLFGSKPISPGLNITLRAGWQFSKFTAVWRVLRGFQSAWANTDNMLADFSVAIWKLKDLAMLVASNNGQGAADLKSRMQLMAVAQSILRATVIDADEEFTHETRNIAGISEILTLYMSRVCAAADMPMTRLFGTSPGGLNATGESDIEFFDDRVQARQEDELTPQLEKLVKIQMQILGYAGDDWCIYYPSLRQETDAEKATARKTQADTDAIYIDRGVLTPEEVTLHRFGGDEYSFETPLDLDARAIEARQQEREMKEAEAMQAQVDAAKAAAEKGAGASDKPTAPFPRADFDPDQPRDESGRWGEGGAALPAVTAGKTRLYRAASKAEVARGAHFSPERETAEAYQDNPGFGGPNLYGFDVDDDYHLDVSKLSGNKALRALAEGLEYEDPQTTAEGWSNAGLHEIFHVLENNTDAANKAQKLYDWVSFKDDFPAGAITRKYLGDKKFLGNRIVQDRKDYDPDQPRDESGRWGEGGGSPRESTRLSEARAFRGSDGEAKERGLIGVERESLASGKMRSPEPADEPEPAE